MLQVVTKDSRCFIPLGYHKVRNVSVKTMIVQDILNEFRRRSLVDWRCTISKEYIKDEITVDHLHKVVILCPIFVYLTGYTYAKQKITNIISDFSINKPKTSPRITKEWLEKFMKIRAKGGRGVQKSVRV